MHAGSRHEEDPSRESETVPWRQCRAFQSWFKASVRAHSRAVVLAGPSARPYLEEACSGSSPSSVDWLVGLPLRRHASSRPRFRPAAGGRCAVTGRRASAGTARVPMRVATEAAMRDRREIPTASQIPVISSADNRRPSGTSAWVRDWCNGADPGAGSESPRRRASFAPRGAGLQTDWPMAARLSTADRAQQEDGA
jgi:hypothetical protein